MPSNGHSSSPVSGAGAPATGAAGADVWRALALLAQRVGDAAGASGEPVVSHAEGTVEILQALRTDEPTQTAAALFGAGEQIPHDEIERQFGAEVATMASGMRQLLRLRGIGLRISGAAAAGDGQDLEILRRMFLAMTSDLRVVLIRLASRLQTLRFHAARRTLPDAAIARETLQVLAPLANRLGLGQLKWELEDLAFRFLEPEVYKGIASQLEERRVEREQFVTAAVARLKRALAEAGIGAEVSGRPKHIYSIYNKMRTKGLTLTEIQDLRAFRVIVGDVKDCYAVLGIIHHMWPPVPREFDDYISRPKPNGYQSLHTVVIAEDGRPLEIQIRTHAMHRHAEYGVASHWRYKEAAAGGPAPPAPTHDQRISWMRQLLAWQQEVGAALGSSMPQAVADSDRIYVLTPQARVVELPAGATPVDFAYHVHTELGHRCRGARVDGQMVPLNTVLRNGQTVEIVTARAGAGSEGPSRDWLNPQLGYVRSQRARTKVRQWFNAQELEREIAVGRERIERIMQREGRTALKFEELARRLGYERVDELFAAAGRDEIGPRALEEAVRGQLPQPEPEPQPAVLRGPSRTPDRAGVLVVGVDFLMTQLARCCRPAPPDPIVGFVTRGRGVSVHRVGCRSFAEMARRAPERVLPTSWGVPGEPRVYPVDVVLRARDRQGLLRDVSDVFARDKLNVIAVQSVSRGHDALMQFTVEVPDIERLNQTLVAVRDVSGVIEARRKQ